MNILFKLSPFYSLTEVPISLLEVSKNPVTYSDVIISDECILGVSDLAMLHMEL